jgi:hypothetical protein
LEIFSQDLPGIGGEAFLPVLDFHGTEGTGGHAGAAAYAHLDGQQHRGFPRLLLLQQLAGAGTGRLANTVCGVAGQGVTSFEVYVGVFVHARRKKIIYIRTTMLKYTAHAAKMQERGRGGN